jgi:hypothetical protein
MRMIVLVATLTGVTLATNEERDKDDDDAGGDDND